MVEIEEELKFEVKPTNFIFKKEPGVNHLHLVGPVLTTAQVATVAWLIHQPEDIVLEIEIRIK